MPMITTERGDFYYKDYRRKADAPAIVLIHGAGGIYLDWAIEMRRDLGAIALDLSGHGRSGGEGHQTITGYAQDIVAFLDALHIEKATLIGHSMGGAISQQIALDFPNYVECLVLIATGARLKVGDAILQGIQHDMQATAELIVALSWTKEVDDAIKQQGVERLLNTPKEVIYKDFLACNAFDVRTRLAEISIPAFVIAGTADKMTPLAWNQALAEGLPSSTLHIIEGQGHQLHVEKAATVTNWISTGLSLER